MSTGIGFQNPNVPTVAPAGYWNLNDTGADQSGNGHNLTLKGATFSTDVPGVLGTGKSLSFSGSSQDAYADIDVSEDAYTLSLWFKTSTTGRGIFMATDKTGGAGTLGHDRDIFLSGVNIDAFVKTQLVVGTGKPAGVTTWADGNWHHLAHVYQRDTLGQKIYVDGFLIRSGSKSFSDFVGQNRIYIGQALQTVGSNKYFQGNIDDVAIWNVALTPAQIAALYAGTSPGDSGSFSNSIATNIASSMQNVNSTAYLRVPFQIEDVSQYHSLFLTMNYDDGFVAYLNGTEVAHRNAPATPQWNSTAHFALHPGGGSVARRSTSEFQNLGANGNNLLAIQGLNVDKADSDFLVLPKLADIDRSHQSNHFFAVPSPGAANNTNYFAKVQDTNFDHNHGFFDTPFDLTITTDTPGAVIRYTTDGTTPTATTGTIYTVPVTISSTTSLRAAAFKDGFVPTNVDTQTYIFLDDVINQSPTGTAAPGFPQTSTTGQVLDYGIDPDVVNNPQFAPLIKDALKAIPTISLVTDTKNLFDPATGIYTHASSDGRDWERARLRGIDQSRWQSRLHHRQEECASAAVIAAATTIPSTGCGCFSATTTATAN